MAQVIRKKKLDIYEVKTDDGGIGLQFGDGSIFMGYDAADLFSLLFAIFPDPVRQDPLDHDPIDAELIDLAKQYLDPKKVNQRIELLRSLAKDLD